MNGPDICVSPKLPTSVWNELCAELNPPTEITDLDIEAEDDDSLKSKALNLWEQRDRGEDQRNRCELAIAPILYVQCKKLNAQGKKGKGFRSWLVNNNKKPTTAYRWIREYAGQNDLVLPYSHKAKTKHASCHLAQSSDTATVKAIVGSSVANPALHIPQMNESEQVALLNIGSFAEVLNKATELIEKPAKEFQSASQSYDPATQEIAVYGDSNYHWTAEDNSAELARAQAYMAALKTTLNALNREAKQARSLVNTLKKYIEQLNNNNQAPLFQVVPGKVPQPANDLQKEVA